MPDYAQFGNFSGQNSIFSAFNALGPSVLWFAFAGSLIVFCIFNWVLSYHWNKFSLDPGKTWWVVFIYTAVAALLLGIMLISILKYSGSTSSYIPYT